MWLERHGVEIPGLKSAEKVDSVQYIQTVRRNVAKESDPNVSRPFKYLKDAITVHIKQACKLLGDNNEGSKGKVLEPMADRKSREIGVAQPDGENIESEPVDAVGNQTDTTGGKSLVSLNDSYKITGSAKEKVFELKFYRKRSMGTGDDEFSRKRAKAENMDSIDNQSEKSGEDNKIMGDSKGDVQVSNMSVPRVKHGDEDSSSERKFQLSPRTSSNLEAVTWLRRSGQREPRKVKDGRSSDVGMKKEVGDGESSQHSYIRMHGKSGVLRVLKSSKNVAGFENANVQCEEQGNTMRLRSWLFEHLKVSNEFQPDQVTYGVVIHGLCQSGYIGKALQALNVAENKLNVYSYSSMINGLCKNDRLDEAVSIFDQMARQGCHPNSHIYDTLINGFCQASKMKLAVRSEDKAISDAIHGSMAVNDVEIDNLEPKLALKDANALPAPFDALPVSFDGDTWNNLLSAFKVFDPEICCHPTSLLINEPRTE